MNTRINRRLLIIFVMILLLAALFGGNMRTRNYVRSHRQELEAFAIAALEYPPPHGTLQYGRWAVSCYPEKGMVEFFTGGFGLAPSTVYRGFYYSAGDAHTPFQGIDQPLEVTGSAAEWREPESDNWGRSRRIMPHWFWYEAHF